jgi:hypothetical protein
MSMAVSIQSLLLFSPFFSHISTRVCLPVKWLRLVVVNSDVTNLANNTVRMMTAPIEFEAIANIVVFFVLTDELECKFFCSNHNNDNNIGHSMTLH